MARERRDAARRDIAHGIDPALRRKCERICVSNTFEFVAREFIDVLQAANMNPETRSQTAIDVVQQILRSSPARRIRSREPISSDTVDSMQRRLKLHDFPYIDQQDLRLLRAPDLLEVLRRIESRGTYDLAHRVRSICSRVFRYARATGRRCEDIAADLIGSLTPVESEVSCAATQRPAECQLQHSTSSSDTIQTTSRGTLSPVAARSSRRGRWTPC